MATTLPTLTRTLDDDFMNTWYEIRAMIEDQVTSATVLWAALKFYGCLTPQEGGEYITRSIRYGQASTQRFSKGKVLTQRVVKLDTMARWDWKYFLVDVNRSLVDDLKNAGPFKIKDYLTARMEAARDALIQDAETYLTQWERIMMVMLNRMAFTISAHNMLQRAQLAMDQRAIRRRAGHRTAMSTERMNGGGIGLRIMTRRQAQRILLLEQLMSHTPPDSYRICFTCIIV